MRLLALLVSVLALVVPRRRGSAPPESPSPSSPPLVSSPADPPPRRRLALPIASPAYRDGLGPVPEPGRVRPYLVAAERRRAEQVWQGLREELAEIARMVVEQPDPDPVPGPDPEPAAAAAVSVSVEPPSPETLRLILSRLRELDAQAMADVRAGATAGVCSVRSGGGW